MPISKRIRPLTHRGEEDRWTREVQPRLKVVVDSGYCIVLHFCSGASAGLSFKVTISNVEDFCATLIGAKNQRDLMLETAEQKRLEKLAKHRKGK